VNAYVRTPLCLAIVVAPFADMEGLVNGLLPRVWGPRAATSFLLGEALER